jgi:hypothetical protein
MVSPPVHLGSEPEVAVHAVTAGTAELDIVAGNAAPTPGLQRSTASTAGIAANGDEAGNDGFDDSNIVVVIVGI